jgi:parallel beta-helix repeat protein
MTNTTISGNTALGTNGGGIWVSYDPTGTLLNCTIANNHLAIDWTVGAAIFDTGTGKNLTLKNTIVSGNTANVPRGCNLSYNGSPNLQWPAGALCTANPLIADPLLGTLGNNGGPTETMLPGSTSPARGLGTGCPETDQRGKPRHVPCTLGAVE